MDTDLHYYGTYALARAAGIRRDAAAEIATAAQYVDDSDSASAVVAHPSGARFSHETTAHHPADLMPNNDLDDQLRVWVPFHFVPGAVGASFSEKLICRKDSDVARKMVDHHLGMAGLPFGIELIGMTAHVYADTFAHFGFSGVSSRLNRVAPGSLEVIGADPLLAALEARIKDTFFAKYGGQGGLLDNFRRMVDNAEGAFAEIAMYNGAVGHGAVATFPDQPFLHWRYRYERPDLLSTDAAVERNNAADYLDGCRAVHALLSNFVSIRPDIADPAAKRSFDAIADVLKPLLTFPGDRDARIALWKRVIGEGGFSGTPGDGLPDYAAGTWRQALADLKDIADPSDALRVPAYRFQQAAAMHRQYMLRELLPKHGLVLI